MYETSAAKAERKMLLREHKCRWEDKIKIDQNEYDVRLWTKLSRF